MKKLLLLLLVFPFFIACSSDDDNNIDKKEPTQDYTSFVVHHNEDVVLPNCIAAYKKDNKYYKIASLGVLTKGKYSDEIKIEDNSIKEFFIFSDYFGGTRLDDIYTLKSNIKNDILIKPHTKGIEIADKTDPTQYPQ